MFIAWMAFAIIFVSWLCCLFLYIKRRSLKRDALSPGAGLGFLLLLSAGLMDVSAQLVHVPNKTGLIISTIALAVIIAAIFLVLKSLRVKR